MRPKRRFWVLVALAAAASAWAVVVGRPVLLVAVCGVCAWLIAQQYRFLATLRTVSDALECTQRSSAARTVTEGTTFLTLTARVEPETSLTLAVEPSVPVGANGTVEPLTLTGAATETTGTFELAWPVAGRFRIEAPTVTATDRLGLFEQRLRPAVDRPAVTVEPRRPRTVHVGEGGDPIAAGFGEHETGQTGRGLEPAEVRKYVAGDAFRRIDWKATARLNETHVREFTTQTDRETRVIVDHRSSMATGPPGERKYDYARHVALAFVEHARETSDRIGCQTVGDEGITGVFEPRAAPDTLRRITRHLESIEATSPDNAASASRRGGPTPTPPDRVREARERLADDGTTFATRLRPFFDRPDAYVRTISDKPLFGAVEAASAQLGGSRWTVIVTDDTGQTETREAVKLASRNGPVLVFLLPSVLFEPGGLDDLDAAYASYVEFEEFRRELASLRDVSAFEVGPADRLSTVLGSGTRQQPSTTRNQ